MTRLMKGNVGKPPIDLDIPNNQFTWRRWFDDVYKVLGPFNNIQGVSIPVFTGLTTTGNPIITAEYYRFGFFLGLSIYISANGGSTASVAGTTYCNLPFPALAEGFCVANDVNTKINIGSGFIQKDPGGIYTPSWSASSNDISISGFYLVEQ